MTCAFTERMIAARSVGRHLAAQQHLVADDERGDGVGVFLGEARPRSRSCAKFLARLLPSQMPWITFSPPILVATAGTWSSPFSIE